MYVCMYVCMYVMNQGLSWEAQPVKKFPTFCWNPKLRYCVYKFANFIYHHEDKK
jgi:hypothetical protein